MILLQSLAQLVEDVIYLGADRVSGLFDPRDRRDPRHDPLLPDR